jgi:hypothetical protein
VYYDHRNYRGEHTQEQVEAAIVKGLGYGKYADLSVNTGPLFFLEQWYTYPKHYSDIECLIKKVFALNHYFKRYFLVGFRLDLNTGKTPK